MQKFKDFFIHWYSFDNNTHEAEFYYSFDNDMKFIEKIDFNSLWFSIRDNINETILNNLLHHISIALAISYYKLYPTKKIVIENHYLDDSQKAFWKNFYEQWLWEFLYKNNISPIWLLEFVWDDTISTPELFSINTEKALVPIGGGKDSLVSIELLKQNNIQFDMITFWKDYPLHSSVANEVGEWRFVIKRFIDMNLFSMIKEWYYNGHVPVTWIIAFVLLIVSYLYEYKYIVMSNEKSSDFWNFEWEWLQVNHQYSKSFQFEKDFSDYVNNNISSDVKYFSLLRWLYEINIIKKFAEIWKYFWVFSGCNNNFKILSENRRNHKWNKRWCLDCPKCAFVFACMYPFLYKEQILEIFWADMYEDESKETLFKELLWVSWNKPFECVWTNEEVVYAMSLALSNNDGELPFMLKIFEQEIFQNISKKELNLIESKLLHEIYGNNIPQLFKAIV